VTWRFVSEKRQTFLPAAVMLRGLA